MLHLRHAILLIGLLLDLPCSEGTTKLSQTLTWDHSTLPDRCVGEGLQCAESNDEHFPINLLQVDLNFGNKTSQHGWHAASSEEAEQHAKHNVSQAASKVEKANSVASPEQGQHATSSKRPAFASQTRFGEILHAIAGDARRMSAQLPSDHFGGTSLPVPESLSLRRTGARDSYGTQSAIRKLVYSTTKDPAITFGLFFVTCLLVSFICTAAWSAFGDDADSELKPSAQQGHRQSQRRPSSGRPPTQASASGGYAAAHLLSATSLPPTALQPNTRSREAQVPRTDAAPPRSNSRELPRPASSGAVGPPPGLGPEPLRSESGTSWPLGAVPPICPKLILIHSEARFVIKFDQLMAMPHPGRLDIRGTSGRTLLHAMLGHTEDGRQNLSLASYGCDDDPRTEVRAPWRPGLGFELYGKAEPPGSRNKLLYGTIDPVPGGTGCTLNYGGQPVLNIEMGDSAELRMTAYATDGRSLATAGREPKCPPEGTDGWKLCVSAGADAVLISSCMLAMVLLRGTNPADRPSALPGVDPSPRGLPMGQRGL